MTTIETGVIIALFLAIIGCYTFTFSTSRSISNHIYAKVDNVQKALDDFCKDVIDRLARIETTLGIEKLKRKKEKK